MQNFAQRSIRRPSTRIGLLSLLISVAYGTGFACAQSGSVGGSIGNDEKSLSGSREAPRSVEPSKPARRSKPEAEEPRRAARKSGGGGSGGGGSFDGAWAVHSNGTPCGSSSTAVVVTSGRIIGEGLTGTVSPNGSAQSFGTYGSITVVSTGRFSGHGGSGTFRRSDGCVGTWSVSKQ